MKCSRCDQEMEPLYNIVDKITGEVKCRIYICQNEKCRLPEVPLGGNNGCEAQYWTLDILPTTTGHSNDHAADTQKAKEEQDEN